MYRHHLRNFVYLLSPLAAFLLPWLWCCASVSVSRVHATPYRGRYVDEGKCTDSETGRELYIGEAFTRPGQCKRVQCLGSLEIWEDSCQQPALSGSCVTLPPTNEFLDYPKCCPLYECITHKHTSTGDAQEQRTYDHYGVLRKTHITQVFVINDPLPGKMPGEGLRTQFDI